MRVLCLSFLLIGHLVCGHLRRGSGSNDADRRSRGQPYSGRRFRGVGANSGRRSSYPSLSKTVPAPQNAFSSPDSYYGSQDFYSTPTNMAENQDFNKGYAGFMEQVYSGPQDSEYAAAYAASGFDSSAPHGSSASGFEGSMPDATPLYEGSDSATFYYPAGSGSAREPEIPEEPEPVFSDVSDLEPVFAFRSRSSYQRGRKVFAQTRYIPGEPAPPPPPPLMPVSRRMEAASEQTRPADAPTKGGS
ncbi:putative keratin type I cytoskeletal 9-like isoform 5 [Scophthalmus maximus]|uniref:Putative keratin type I cytoskeletal 9-like isoform 3 n=1 Tax=Scophthalmus maximus TaxID=52904 RepID=A0A2U9BZ76_SCOMX|nr:putative keratin type I cytoskeletal 9-like isoform 3 [Scophthalmus maximus]AWP09000.1 putative keratin type I cytoskeletal 9-like isoform 5 [Scophthalmus maximus]